jgi:hypothetical protein
MLCVLEVGSYFNVEGVEGKSVMEKRNGCGGGRCYGEGDSNIETKGLL